MDEHAEPIRVCLTDPLLAMTIPSLETTRRRLASAGLLLVTLLLTGCSGPNLVDRASDPFAYGFCGLVVLILDVIAVVEVLNGDRSPGGKLLWILLILLAPIVGLILYYLFGRE